MQGSRTIPQVGRVKSSTTFPFDPRHDPPHAAGHFFMYYSFEAAGRILPAIAGPFLAISSATSCR